MGVPKNDHGYFLSFMINDIILGNIIDHQGISKAKLRIKFIVFIKTTPFLAYLERRVESLVNMDNGVM